MSRASIQNSRPVELFVFLWGNQTYRYTSSPQDITHENQLYIASSIRRGKIKLTKDVEKNGLKLSMSRMENFAFKVLTSALEIPLSVTILQGQSLGDGSLRDVVTLWSGRVTGRGGNKSEIFLECESIFTSLGRNGLGVRYERTCCHALYSKECGVLEKDHRIVGKVVSYDGKSEIEVDCVLEAGIYVSGMVLVSDVGERRTIYANTANRIHISRPLEQLMPGATVIMYAGCDKHCMTCKNKFNNLNNFGGFPWIPEKNPMSDTSFA